MNSHEVFIHIHQGCFAGTGAIVRLPQCQWSKPDGYGKISQCITTTKHSKAKTVCIFLGIYCFSHIRMQCHNDPTLFPIQLYCWRPQVPKLLAISSESCIRCGMPHSLIRSLIRRNVYHGNLTFTWWRHDMEAFSTFPVNCLHKRPVVGNLDIFVCVAQVMDL